MAISQFAKFLVRMRCIVGCLLAVGVPPHSSAERAHVRKGLRRGLECLVQRLWRRRGIRSPITAIARNPNHLDLFVTGTDGRIYSTWWDAATGWAGWFNVSGGMAALGSPITAVARNPDHLDLFVTGTDGRIYSTWWDVASGWAPLV